MRLLPSKSLFTSAFNSGPINVAGTEWGISGTANLQKVFELKIVFE